jgi:hypothetical protein
MREFRNAYKILAGKPEVKRPISRLRCRLNDISKIGSKINKRWGCGVASSGSGWC